MASRLVLPLLLALLGVGCGTSSGAGSAQEACMAPDATWCFEFGDPDYGDPPSCEEQGGMLISGLCPQDDALHGSCVVSDDCGGTDRYFYSGYAGGLFGRESILEHEARCDGCDVWTWYVSGEERPGYTSQTCSTNADCGELQKCVFEGQGYCALPEEPGNCFDIFDACVDVPVSPVCGCDNTLYDSSCEASARGVGNVGGFDCG